MVKDNDSQKITETGHFISVNGERIEIGILKKESGNARIFISNGSLEIKGIFALVQWFKRGRPFEKIAYNTVANSVEEAEKEMAEWMPRLQYPECRENSRLIEIIEHSEKSSVATETRRHV